MHEEYMDMAIEMAKKGQFKTYKNPLVGAVIVKNNYVLAKGAHLYYGQKHAESQALANIHSPKEAINSTLYVTMEPCHHVGKQPACTMSIVEAGIQTVVIGQLDPNPLVSGKGVSYLQEQGLRVIVGIKEQAVRQLNQAYNFFYENKRPFVMLKQAISLDGKIALSANQKTTITGKDVWQVVHKERANYHGIVVGSRTVLADDPSLLTAQVTDFPPVRIILDRRGDTLKKLSLKIFNQAQAPVWLFTAKKNTQSLPAHVRLFVSQKWHIEQVLAECFKEGIQSLYVEGGANIHDAFLASGLWDEMVTYVAPKLLGGRSLASFSSERKQNQIQCLQEVTIEKIGTDIAIRGKKGALCLLD